MKPKPTKKLDLAPTDVHTPAMARKRPKKAPKGGRIHVRADLASGGSIRVSHRMSDKGAPFCLSARPIRMGEQVSPESVGAKLMGAEKWSDGTPKTLVWVQLAVPGAWRGHAQGAFSLTAQTFAEIRSNFDKRGIPLPFDFEHASEQDPTEGSKPLAERSAAQGWIHRLDARQDGLWGLVEWLDVARDGIKAGAYGFLSPAIRLQSRDPVTGEAAGARLTSVAITNNPFLSKLPGLIAASDANDGSTPAVKPAITHSSSHEFMPHIRAALKLDSLAMPRECGDAFQKLREYHAASGGQPTQGVDVPGMVRELRERLRVPMTTPDDDLFDQVEAMIDSAIAEHEAKFHEATGRDSSPTLDDDDGEGGEDGGDGDKEDGAEMRDNGGRISMTDAEKLAQLQGEVGALKLQLSTAISERDSALSRVTLLTAEVESGKSAVSELATIKTKLADEDVTDAIQLYASKGLKEDLRPTLLKVRLTDPEGFALMYPRTNARDRVLTTSITASGSKATEQTAPTAPQGIAITASDTILDVTDKVMASDKNISHEDAQNKAIVLLTARKSVLNGRA